MARSFIEYKLRSFKLHIRTRRRCLKCVFPQNCTFLISAILLFWCRHSFERYRNITCLLDNRITLCLGNQFPCVCIITWPRWVQVLLSPINSEMATLLIHQLPSKNTYVYASFPYFIAFIYFNFTSGNYCYLLSKWPSFIRLTFLNVFIDGKNTKRLSSFLVILANYGVILFLAKTPFQQCTMSTLFDVSLNCEVEQCIYAFVKSIIIGSALLWRHNGHDCVSNHQPHGCLLNRLFRRRSKKTSKLRVTGLFVGNSPEPVNSPHKGPVTRKMFPFDNVIMR